MVGQTCSTGGAIKEAGGDFPTILYVKKFPHIATKYFWLSVNLVDLLSFRIASSLYFVLIECGY